jgi:hypothetical protein
VVVGRVGEGGGGVVGQLFDRCFPRSERRGIRSALGPFWPPRTRVPVLASSALFPPIFFFLASFLSPLGSGFCWRLEREVSKMGQRKAQPRPTMFFAPRQPGTYDPAAATTVRKLNICNQTIQRYLVHVKQFSVTSNPKKMSCTYQIHILSCVKVLEDGRRRVLGTTWMKQNWSYNSDVIQVPWHGSHIQEVHNHYI